MAEKLDLDPTVISHWKKEKENQPYSYYANG
jgi:hypothetical protein